VKIIVTEARAIEKTQFIDFYLIIKERCLCGLTKVTTFAVLFEGDII
jgi:hypothetical protein